MKTKITKYILAGLIIILGFFSWYSVDRAINIENSSTWLIPFVWFSLLFALLSLGAILIKEKIILALIIIGSFFSSLIFVFSIWHIIILTFSFLIAYAGMSRIEKDLALNIKLDLYKSIRMGKALLILAISLGITSQYYFETKNTSKANIIPKFQTSNLTSKILPMFYPNLRNTLNENVTVDDFILEMSKQNSQNILSSLSQDPDFNQAALKISDEQIDKITSVNQQAILKEGRKNLEMMTGSSLTGQENISDIFSEMINKRINDIFSPALSESNMPIVSFVVTLVLFITVISIGPFLGFIAIYLAVFIFWALRKFELVRVSKVMVEAEIIE